MQTPGFVEHHFTSTHNRLSRFLLFFVAPSSSSSTSSSSATSSDKSSRGRSDQYLDFSWEVPRLLVTVHKCHRALWNMYVAVPCSVQCFLLCGTCIYVTVPCSVQCCNVQRVSHHAVYDARAVQSFRCTRVFHEAVHDAHVVQCFVVQRVPRDALRCTKGA